MTDIFQMTFSNAFLAKIIIFDYDPTEMRS